MTDLTNNFKGNKNMNHKKYLIKIVGDNFYKFIDKKDEKNNIGEDYWLKLSDHLFLTKEEYDNILFVCDDPEMLKKKLDILKKRCGI